MAGNNNETENRLWDVANELRANSGLKASEYSVPVLGLIFLRYAEFKFARAEEELKLVLENNLSSRRRKKELSKIDFQAKGVLYLPKIARYSYLLNLPESENIGKAVNDAMEAIEAENPELTDTLPKNYTSFENDLLVALLKAFKLPPEIKGDAFGKIYEYFLGKFAMAEGQKGGKFFTPTSLVVSIDKLTTVRMYDKVQKYWKMHINELKEKRKEITEGEKAIDLEKQISELENTDMAVVISEGQNEVKKFEENGLDIKPHRKRIAAEDLEKIFKDSKSKLKIAFVYSKWREGFDVHSLSTIYLDRPMKDHSLMQTIARANRVFGDKPGGFIVDYAGIFRNLEQALKIYAMPRSGGVEIPIKPKEKLVEALEQKLKEINKFLSGLSVSPDKIIKTKSSFDKINLLKDATDAILINESTKKKFLTEAETALKIYKSILPHKRASEFFPQVTLYEELVNEIRSLDPEVDISRAMNGIQRVLDTSIKPREYIIEESKRAE